ncbi:MAG: adenosine deaminase [Lachnospiraceae bacterium]|nr:adenosine deaminase [Lachnospiraceae bacterium]
MIWFQRFYLDKEKDMIVDLYKETGGLSYILRTPNHNTGNLITNLAKLCGLPLSFDENGLKVICGDVPCYVDGYNREIYIFRLGNTKVANIYPDGTVEMKAQIPSISKTLMSQTKDYRLSEEKTIVKTYIRSECKFRTDLHTHMNANLPPDVLIALGIAHEIRYPLYYIKKLNLRCTAEQEEKLKERRAAAEEKYRDYALTGKYMVRRVDDNTFINFADLILKNPADAAYNIAKIRNSLAIMKDGQAVFTNLEKVYLYRYVFTKGETSEDRIGIFDREEDGGKLPSARNAFQAMSAIRSIPDEDVRRIVLTILRDRENPEYRDNTVFQDKLLWIARCYASRGITYAEISDTTLVKKDGAPELLAQIHSVMPAVTRETGVTLRFLAGIRRIPLTIIKHKASGSDYFRENLQVLSAVAGDPYVAGSDIIGEEINDIRDLRPVICEIVKIAAEDPDFTVRIHAGENDSLRDNVMNSVRCVKESLSPGQPMPAIRIGHGLYTANLSSSKGRSLIRELTESGAVLEFQISSNVRLNNLSGMEKHPLRSYLRAGVRCVQGTDGGALYGTDSIDEQLSLEKMLGLTFEELCAMRRCEEEVRIRGMRGFERKMILFGEQVSPDDGERDVCLFYRKKIEEMSELKGIGLRSDRRENAAAALADRIVELPEKGRPVVLCGGSFNNDIRTTKVTPEGSQMIVKLLAACDPKEHFFVVGHRISGYEKCLIEENKGRFAVFAFVPTLLSSQRIRKIRESGVNVRVSIEPEAMGIYKSISYEVFKRRESILIAMDGNSAGANLIQEAKNAKYKCRIFVNRGVRALREKAESLEGYVTVFETGGEIHGI